MMYFSDLAYVHSTPAHTFRMLTDYRALANHSELLAFVGDNALPFAEEGASFEVEVVLVWLPTRVQMRVESFVPAELLAVRGIGRGVEISYRFQLRPSGPGTQIRLESELMVSPLQRVLGPLFRGRFGDDCSAMLGRWQRTLNEHYRLQRLGITADVHA